MPSILSHISELRQDAVFWQIDRWHQAAGDDIFQHAQVVRDTANLLASIPDDVIRQRYVDAIGKNKSRFGIAKKEIEHVMGKMPKDEPKQDRKKDSDVFDYDAIIEKGYCEVDLPTMVGYWVQGDKNSILQASNFIIRPIFHVAGKSKDSRHIFEVKNVHRTAVVDVPSTALVSKAELQAELVAEGNFVFFGNQTNLLRISSELLQHFPLCYEIKQPGYQREGFFVYLNRIVTPGQAEDLTPDEFGIFQKDEQHFLIPAASRVYAGMRAGEDRFALVKSLTYIKTPVSFSQWAQQMMVVYGDKGQIGVAFALLTALRDFIFSINGNCPHLYGYGERSSGKSQWADSIAAIFTHERQAFNLNAGTEFAFFAYVSAFRNCVARLNEFDDKVCPDVRFQAIKGVFDGEGRMRGRMDSRNAVEVQSVDSTLLLTGQYISTKDDNSIVSRSIIVPFHERQYTDEEKAEFNKLRGWQAEGLTSLSAEIIRHRPAVEKHYANTYSQNLSTWRRATRGEFNERIFQNYCHLATLYFLFQKPLGLPGDWAQFNEYLYSEAGTYSAFIRNSDKLSAFWNTVEALLDARLIEPGWHFSFTELSSITLRDSDGKPKERDLGSIRKLLFIRLDTVHGLYQKMYRERSGETGMSWENIKHYIANRDYFIGQVKQHKFRRIIYRDNEVTESTGQNASRTVIQGGKEMEVKNTSAYVFDYEKLGVALETTNPDLERGSPSKNKKEESIF